MWNRIMELNLKRKRATRDGGLAWRVALSVPQCRAIKVGSGRKRTGEAGPAEAGCLRQLRLAAVNSEEAASRS